VILILTPRANESRDMLQEVLRAHLAKKTIIPVKVKRTEPAEDLAYYLDVYQGLPWDEKARTARAIIAKLEKAQMS
jgi:hypothetical protein